MLSTIRIHEPVSRAEISRLTGLTAPAVGRLVQQLIARGFVSELGRRSKGVGQPPVALGINRSAAHAVGLHLDHNVITGVLTDLGGAKQSTAKRSIDRPSHAEGLELLVDVYRELVAAADVNPATILGIGLVSVGPLDISHGRVLRAPYFPGWSDIPLRDELARALDQTVFFDNNATAAAVGEHFFGSAVNERDFLYVYLGFGVGGGIFADGRVHRGASLNAGEFGHVIVEPGGLPCSCGSRGCLETVASGLSLQRAFGPRGCDADFVQGMLQSGDAGFRAWLDRASAGLSYAVMSAHNLLDVDAVVIGGSLPGVVTDPLLGAVRSSVHTLAIRGRTKGPDVRSGALGEDAAALGAATLPMYEDFIPVPVHAIRRGVPRSDASKGVID